MEASLDDTQCSKPPPPCYVVSSILFFLTMAYVLSSGHHQHLETLLLFCTDSLHLLASSDFSLHDESLSIPTFVGYHKKYRQSENASARALPDPLEMKGEKNPAFFLLIKAYFRQGVALQYLGRHADALAAFASGLAQDPKSLQLLVGMVEAAMKSPMREHITKDCFAYHPTFSCFLLFFPPDSLEPTYQQLQKMKLDKSPFVVVSVVGQELLTAGHHGASVVVLEAALKIGTCSLKLRGSVFSALSSAYWSLGNTEKSTGYMQQDLDVAKTLGDQTGECRAHGNLGSAFFSKGNYREALTNHRHQLVLAMKLKDREVGSLPADQKLFFF
ncbi:hypothetical protein GH733_005335 [Mirounga leonina]|nr:hypothetical protein GH733_005335 [Mirounga leonina]